MNDDFAQIADDLEHSVTSRLPAVAVDFCPQHGGGVAMDVTKTNTGARWQILMSAPDASGAVITHVVDPDGDSIKNLFDTPQDAADYVVSQLLPNAA